MNRRKRNDAPGKTEPVVVGHGQIVNGDPLKFLLFFSCAIVGSDHNGPDTFGDKGLCQVIGTDGAPSGRSLEMLVEDQNFHDVKKTIRGEKSPSPHSRTCAVNMCEVSRTAIR